MACGDYATFWEYWINGQFMDGVTCPYADAMGGVLFALVVFAAIAVALYLYSESIVLPLTVSVVVGAAVITQLPGAATQIAGIVLVLGLAIGGLLVVNRLNEAR